MRDIDNGFRAPDADEASDEETKRAPDNPLDISDEEIDDDEAGAYNDSFDFEEEV